jgi:hypothetical protein
VGHECGRIGPDSLTPYEGDGAGTQGPGSWPRPRVRLARKAAPSPKSTTTGVKAPCASELTQLSRPVDVEVPQNRLTR